MDLFFTILAAIVAAHWLLEPGKPASEIRVPPISPPVVHGFAHRLVWELSCQMIMLRLLILLALLPAAAVVNYLFGSP